MSPDLGLGDVLRAIAELVSQYRERLDASREQKDAQVVTALRMLEELTALHVKAVVAVCVPVLEDGDIVTTASSYQHLVDDPAFPKGYGMARGILEQAYGLKEFRGSYREAIQGVLLQLHAFQTAGFMLGYGSGVAADSLNVARDFHELARQTEDGASLGHPARERFQTLQTDVSARFHAMFQWLAAQTGQQSDLATTQVSSAADVVHLGQAWARQWKTHVQNTLYGGRGLDYVIGRLKLLLSR